MKEWETNGRKQVMNSADKDELYQQLLSNYRDMETAYDSLAQRMPPEDLEIIERYLAAGEAVYYRFAQLAYRSGRRSRTKE